MSKRLLQKVFSILLAILVVFSGIMVEPVYAGSVTGDVTVSTPSNAERRTETEADEVIYNLGTMEVRVSENIDDEDAALTFDENGNFQIYIGEDNPYFPYEVQFKYLDRTWTEWFEGPDDSVTVGGHVFTLALENENEYTKYTLNIGGEEKLMYPRRKEFTNNPASMFRSVSGPVKRRKHNFGGTLEVDLREYTPVELTKVQLSGLFAGVDINGRKIMIKDRNKDRFIVKNPTDTINLNMYVNSYGDSSYFQMTVGDNDQLSYNETEYGIRIKCRNFQNWLGIKLNQYLKDSTKENIVPYAVSFHSSDSAAYHADFSKDDLIDNQEENTKFTISLYVNKEIFSNFDENTLYYYEGELESEDKISIAKDVTDEVKNGTYRIEFNKDYQLTMVQKNSDNTIKGFLPMRGSISAYRGNIQFGELLSDNNSPSGFYTSSEKQEDGKWKDFLVRIANDPNRPYGVKLSTDRVSKAVNEEIVAAYIGDFSDLNAAQTSGAEDIHTQLFGSTGYIAVYDPAIPFTIFTSRGNVHYVRVKIKQIRPRPIDPGYPDRPDNPEETNPLSSDTRVVFYGLKDANGELIPGYLVNTTADSYGEYNYQTMMVADNVDLDNVAPVFAKMDKTKLYVSGSSTEEVSGETLHNLSEGSIQYTASAEDQLHQGNYWLQVVKPSSQGMIYINSLIDKDAKTSIIDGVIYSTREILMDSAHGDIHDIIALNLGDSQIDNISTELESDTLVLDDYWSLKGIRPLAAYEADENAPSYMHVEELLEIRPVNMVNIRLNKAEGVERGANIQGKLKIKSGDKLLAEITLKGTIGDPIITTETIPDAVKYVPYGTMIQNNNKYSWNVPTYKIYSGALPQGMVLKANGELYGVPKEAGDFNFTVRMDLKGNRNSLSEEYSASHTKEFTLKVADNTDNNVNQATDAEYYLRPDTASDGTGKVPDFMMQSTQDSYLMISNGEFGEYQDLYLDGEKLVKDVDYTADSGSTRLTIKAETLKKNGEGTHTLGMEFRDSKADTSTTSMTRTDAKGNLKKAAQNYRIGVQNDSGGNSSGGNSSGGGSSSGGSSGGGSSRRRSGSSSTGGTGSNNQSTSNNSGNTAQNVTRAADYATTVRPNTTGNWVHDGKNWSFEYSNQNYKGWIVVNSRWYYLDEEGNLVTGWKLIDGDWYLFHYTDDATLGAMEVGWNNFNDKWYLLAEADDRKMGSLYINTVTPDGYTVGADGSRQ